MKYVYKRPIVRAAVGMYDVLGSLVRRRRRTTLPPPERIAVLLLHQIGDAVLALPTLSAIRKAVPHAQVDLIVGSSTRPLLEPSLAGLQFHTFDASWDATVRHTLGSSLGQRSEEALRDLLSQIRPNAALAFHPDLRVNRTLGKCSIRCTVAFANAGGGFWLTDPVEVPSSGHQVTRNFALARQFGHAHGIDVGDCEAPRLDISGPVVVAVQERLDALGLSSFACVHPFGRFSSRNWIPDRWLDVFAYLKDRGMTTIVVGGPKDDAGPFLKGDSSVIDLTGQLSLPELAALQSKARLFLGIDSGPGHIAAAVGCPVVSVFSAANVPERWSPFGPRVRVVTQSIMDRSRFPLEATDLEPGSDPNPYTEGISASEVIAAAESLLTEASP